MAHILRISALRLLHLACSVPQKVERVTRVTEILGETSESASEETVLSFIIIPVVEIWQI